MANRRPIFDSLIRPFRDVIFPPLCFVCENLLTPEEEMVCESCLSAIRCVSIADRHYRETLAGLTSEGTISGLVAAYYFETGGPLQEVVQQLTYGGMTSLGVLLGQQVGKRVRDELAGEQIAGIIPIPLHFSKKRERGYNQSEYICKGICAVLGVPVEPKMVMRKIYTQSQTTLSREERQQNVTGAFALRRHAAPRVKDATYLLVDDVVTTGATMRECARAILDGGASRVIACAAALAL